MRNTTTQNATVFELLTEPQRLAIEALLSGASTTDAALSAGVDRSTLYRWRKDDCTFQAALSAAKRERWEQVNSLFLNLATQAAGVVSGALAAGDVKAALSILRAVVQLGQSENREPDDPEPEMPRGLTVILASDPDDCSSFNSSV